MQKLNLPEKLKDIVTDFNQKLKDTYQDGLISVILYGSVASQEFTERHSNINLLVVLDSAGLKNLNRVSGILNKRRFARLQPLLFTEDYIRTSCDVFPIEFLDMKENYFVLYGKDVLKDLRIDIRNLRFQCEQELKAKLINIRQFYLKNRNNKNALKNLLFKSCTSVIHILRNLIRLKNKVPPYLKEDVLKEINNEFRLDTSILSMILEAKSKNLWLNSEALLSNFLKSLEEIIETVDKL